MHRVVSRLVRRFLRPIQTLEGYEQPELVEVIFRKTVAYQHQHGWPTICPGASSVMDFGGGCGLHYKQAQSATVRWAVVETPAMVERAKELATDRLKFFADISEASAWLGNIDVMHSNGALQYTPDPERALTQLCNLRAKKMLWHRVALGEPKRERQSSLLGDNGPGTLNVKEKVVRFELTRITEQTFLNAHAGYAIADRGTDWFQFVRIV